MTGAAADEDFTRGSALGAFFEEAMGLGDGHLRIRITMHNEDGWLLLVHPVDR